MSEKTPVLKRVAFLLIRVSMVPLVVRKVVQRSRVTIVLYHNISPAAADAQLRLLRDRYNIISLREYVLAREQGMVDRLPPRALIVTLDDGHRANAALLSVLRKYGIKATIFLCSGMIDTRRHILSRSEIETLRSQVDFQSHTVGHAILPCCSDEQAEQEISASKADLEHDHNLDIFALAYPGGCYSDRDIELTRNAGYRCAVTVDSGFNTATTDPFRLRRICMRDDTQDANEVIVRASGVWDIVRRWLTGHPSGYVTADRRLDRGAVARRQERTEAHAGNRRSD
jgi:peptidoglycan/xylan/chitin deacetylase (PgdA/CDA1 family)